MTTAEIAARVEWVLEALGDGATDEAVAALLDLRDGLVAEQARRVA